MFRSQADGNDEAEYIRVLETYQDRQVDEHDTCHNKDTNVDDDE